MNVALRADHINILSLCTGGGGLDLGFELAIPGARSVCMVEREAFAVAQLVSAMEAGLLAPAPIWSDARTFDGRAWRGAVDGLIGGIPCQPHSLAGKRLGEEDARDLWSTARRIIVQSGAWFVLIENVRGMLSSGGAERVWRDLRRLGFEVEGGLFTASEVGASHERERVFILAVADDAFWRRGDLAIARQPDQRDIPHRGHGISMADTIGQRLEGSDGRKVREQQPAFERSRENLVDAIGRGRRAGRNDHGSDERIKLGATGQHNMEHTQGLGRGEGWPKSELRSGRDTVASASGPMDDASIARGRGISVQPRGQNEAGSNFDRTGLFPPGPGDLSRWGSFLASSPELEPAFRRVANGLASRLDIARVDRLRMLGNGVVSLEAAYAIRTLGARLAAAGSLGATQLVRMMEAA